MERSNKKLFGVLVVILLMSCSPKQQISQDLDNFSHVIVISGTESHFPSGHIQFYQNEKSRIDVNAKSKDSVSWTITDDTLLIAILGDAKTNIMLSSPIYKSIKCVGVKNIEFKDTILQSSLEFDACAVENAKLLLDIDTLKFKVSAYENIEIIGCCDTASIDAHYSYAFSELNAWDFVVKNMQIACGMASTQTFLNVTNHLWIKEAIDSKIYYRGNPQIKEANIRYSTLKSNVTDKH